MNIQNLKDKLPDYAKDIKLNLSSVLTEEGAEDLSEKQIFAIALASAYATKNPQLIKSFSEEAKIKCSKEQIHAAKISASLMGMNNIYYRFVHLVEDKEYGTLPAKLRMNAMMNTGIEKTEFELYSLAVSAINGCGMCISSHAKTVEKHGISKIAVQSTIRIAAVINSVASVLAIEL